MSRNIFSLSPLNANETFMKHLLQISDDECPNYLVEENNKIYLYNKKKTNIPGVNPIIFNNLEEYVQFLEFQRSKGIHCPVLELKKSYHYTR